MTPRVYKPRLKTILVFYISFFLGLIFFGSVVFDVWQEFEDPRYTYQFAPIGLMLLFLSYTLTSVFDRLVVKDSAFIARRFKRKIIRFADIEEIRYSPSRKAIEIVSSNKRIRVSRYYSGYDDLKEEIIENFQGLVHNVDNPTPGDASRQVFTFPKYLRGLTIVCFILFGGMTIASLGLATGLIGDEAEPLIGLLMALFWITWLGIAFWMGRAAFSKVTISSEGIEDRYWGKRQFVPADKIESVAERNSLVRGDHLVITGNNVTIELSSSLQHFESLCSAVWKLAPHAIQDDEEALPFPIILRFPEAWLATFIMLPGGLVYLIFGLTGMPDHLKDLDRISDWTMMAGTVGLGVAFVAYGIYEFLTGVRRLIFYPDRIECSYGFRNRTYSPADLKFQSEVIYNHGAAITKLTFDLDGRICDIAQSVTKTPLRVLYRRLREAYGLGSDAGLDG